MGVDWFRLDAIKHLFEDGPVLEHTPATHAWLQEFYPFCKGINPDAVIVGEIWSTMDDVVKYVGGELDIAFEFELANATLESAVSGRKASVERKQQSVIDTLPAGPIRHVPGQPRPESRPLPSVGRRTSQAGRHAATDVPWRTLHLLR